jgi:hypothetical protein
MGHEEIGGNPMTRGLEWLKLGDVPFQASRHLLNPWHDNQRVQHSRDGQELETSVGENLCQLWERIPSKRQFQFPPPPSCLPMPQFPGMHSQMVRSPGCHLTHGFTVKSRNNKLGYSEISL